MMIGILVPLGICVVLPVLILWLIKRTSINSDNRRAEVLIEAIKSNNAIDVDKLLTAFATQRRTPREILSLRLLRGCAFTAAGVGVFVVCAIMFAGGGLDLFMDRGVSLLMLCAGILSIAIGVSYLIVYKVTRKEIGKSEDIEAE